MHSLLDLEAPQQAQSNEDKGIATLHFQLQHLELTYTTLIAIVFRTMEWRMVTWKPREQPSINLRFFGCLQETYEYSKALDKPWNELACRITYDLDNVIEELRLQNDNFGLRIWWYLYRKVERGGGRVEWIIDEDIVFLDPKEYIVL